jgi:hypothetical protein
MEVSELAEVRHFVITREDDDEPALFRDVATLVDNLADECQDVYEWPIVISVNVGRTFMPDVADWNGKGTDWRVEADVTVGTRGWAVVTAESTGH